MAFVSEKKRRYAIYEMVKKVYDRQTSADNVATL